MRKCEICGETRALIIHHKNHNRKDNEKDNLKTLCANCHFEHHFKGIPLKKLKQIYDKQKIIEKGESFVIRRGKFVILMFINRI